MARFAVLSYHTSPLQQAGTGDAGGMNVYVRELSSALARLGHEVDVYARRDDPACRETVLVEPGLRVHHVTAGPPAPLARERFIEHVDAYSAGVAAAIKCGPVPDVIHANYWLSGLAGHQLKHEFAVPLVMTFHTLERVKAAAEAGESDHRASQEAGIIACADAVLASCQVEADQVVELYGATPARVRIVPLGVQHAFFSPGNRSQARRALGLEPSRALLAYVGRLQPLKGVDLALETLVALRSRGHAARLAIIGGPSGPEGPSTLAELHRRVGDAGVIDDVMFVAPQSHQMLSSWLRAADVTLVPSRSESFGLVALESSACGTPVLASSVGGLRNLVEPGVNGRLLEHRDPAGWADAALEMMDGERDAWGARAAALAARYTWRAAGEELVDLVSGFAAAGLVRC